MPKTPPRERFVPTMPTLPGIFVQFQEKDMNQFLATYKDLTGKAHPLLLCVKSPRTSGPNVSDLADYCNGEFAEDREGFTGKIADRVEGRRFEGTTSKKLVELLTIKEAVTTLRHNSGVVTAPSLSEWTSAVRNGTTTALGGDTLDLIETAVEKLPLDDQIKMDIADSQAKRREAPEFAEPPLNQVQPVGAPASNPLGDQEGESDDAALEMPRVPHNTTTVDTTTVDTTTVDTTTVDTTTVVEDTPRPCSPP